MPQLVSEKFNVAWFKLAEFVQRKEKERALALYRLLVHSVLDAALILQLEGDLLLAFKDEKAVELYKRAALLYEETGRHLEAVLVYEHIAKIVPPSLELTEKMFHLYTLLGHETKKTRCAAQIVRILLEAQEEERLEEFFAQLTLSSSYKAVVHETYVLTFLKRESYAEQPFLQKHIDAVLDGYLTDPEHKKISVFLNNLAVLDANASAYAQEILQA